MAKLVLALIEKGADPVTLAEGATPEQADWSARRARSMDVDDGVLALVPVLDADEAVPEEPVAVVSG